MKKIYTILVFLFAITNLFSQALNGDYYIPQGSNPQGFSSLSEAISSLNLNGLNGTVRFLIYDNLNETGSNLVINRNDLSPTNNLIIKPALGKSPIVTITSCAVSTLAGTQSDTAKRQAGLTLVSSSFITFDGTNTDNGLTRNLTIKLNDPTNGIQAINLWGDCNNIIIKNIKIDYTSISSSTSTRGIYLNGQWVGVSDSVLIENNQIGNGLIDPYYCISNTGSSSLSFYTSKIYVKSNLCYGRMRPIYFYYAGSQGTFSEISNNLISIINAPNSGSVVWGTLLNYYKGSINYSNNIVRTIRQASSTTEGIYLFGTMNGQSNISLDIFNNFLGGDIDHIGTGIPASIDLISFQDAPANANVKIFHNTLLFNNISKTAGRNTCIRFNPSSGSLFEIKNNLILNNKNSVYAYGLYYAGTVLNFTSNFNNIYVLSSANIGYAMSNRQTMNNWSSTFSPSQDINSVSKNVEFVSTTDLHLAGSSVGDNDLTGTVIAGYNTDIDGDIRDAFFPYMGADENTQKSLHSLSPRTIPMTASVSNADAFGTKGSIGADQWTSYFAHWDDNYLYLGWNGGKTNYSSDMYYAAIDIDPDGNNGCVNPIEGVSFKNGGPKPDFYVVYENNSSFYGAPTSNGNAVEIYNGSSGTWNWVSRTDGNDNTSSKVVFSDNAGEVRLRIPWSTLGITPGASTKLGLVMWNNNGSGNWLWGRVPLQNPNHGSSVILDYQFIYSSTGAGVNPSIDMISTPLPVELSSFSALAKGNNVQLNWKTATEKDNYGFDVERSINNVWEKVGFVQGNGNSNSVKEYSFVDNSVKEGKYSYRLKQVDNSGKYTYSNVVEVDVAIPDEYSLTQNYPNPFNPSTTISYKLPMQSKVQLNVYSINGELVASLVNEEQSAGSYNINFDASKLATGTYIYRLIANDFIMTKKMLLIK